MLNGELNNLSELYLTLGLGGVSFLVLVSAFGFILNRILPILQKIQQDGAVTQSIIQNNTKAIEEMSKSNQNVATALTILDKSMTNVHSDVKKVVQTNEKIEHSLLLVDERVKRIGGTSC